LVDMVSSRGKSIAPATAGDKSRHDAVVSAVPATFMLPGGAAIPRVGLGVYRARPGAGTRSAILAALELGYRHIDTAAAYGNEADVGHAVRESGIPRERIFVTTKLWNEDQGFDRARRAFDASLDRLGLEWVDLYLLHWPVPKRRLDSWRALEALHEQGRARAIGVSNFMVPHLEELRAAARVPPAVNQIEVHPFLQQRDVRAWCAAHGVVVEAYSPLTKGRRLAHPVVAQVAEEVHRTPAQVLLRWGLQRDMVVLPKSVHPERMAENFALFDFALPAAALARLDALEEGAATGWDPREQP
jgi:diketogulonate reductase-like aldo/keto reductase